ncbi:hypothetical protein [Gleimia europaea]|nr:hypothetical protein [Gleimia europaea]
MEEQGQPYTVVRYDENAPLQETTNAVGRKLFNLEIAQKYGYHNAPQLRFSAEEAQNRYSANDAAWSAATAEC